MFSYEDWAYKRVTVPFQLLQHSVRTGKFTPSSIVVAAKMMFGEHFDESDIPVLAEVLDLTPRTVRHHLAQLVTLNWLGYDPARKRYFNRGWDYYRRTIDTNVRTGYHIHHHQLQDYKAVAIAATYDYLIAIQQYREWARRREGSQKGTPHQTGKSSDGYYPVANDAYAQIYGISTATASRYRKCAADAGYLRVRQEYVRVQLEMAKFNNVAKVRRYSGRPVIFRNGFNYIQLPSTVYSLMRRKKLKALGKGIRRLNACGCACTCAGTRACRRGRAGSVEFGVIER